MEWISVKDKLPENDDVVLVYNWRDGISTGEYIEEDVSWYIESDGSKFYTCNGWSVDYDWAPHEHTTHWMPLPQPPKE